MAFLLATIAEYGDDGWRTTGRGCVTTASRWSTTGSRPTTNEFSGSAAGSKPLVVSYASSPPCEVIYADPPRDDAPTGVIESSCFRQIEYAGVLAVPTIRRPPEALDRLPVSEPFQETVALNLFVFPANEDVDLPPEFVEHTVVPDDPATLDPAADRSAARRVDRRLDPGGAALIAAGPAAARTASIAGFERRSSPSRPLFLLVFYVWPFATLLARGLDLDAARRGAREASRRGTSCGSRRGRHWSARCSTLILGLAPAYVIARYEFAGRRLLNGLLLAVFVLPTVVVAAAFLALLPDSLDRSVWAILAAHVTFNLAVVVRTVGAVWEHLPSDLDAAAATLGASPWRVVREVTLPLLRPALVAAGTIVFLFTFTSFGVIRVLGGAGLATIEVEVWRRATQLGEIDTAAVLTVLQLTVLAAVVGVVHAPPAPSEPGPRAAPAAPAACRPRAGRQRLLVRTVAALTALAVLVPLLALLERSTRTVVGTLARRLGEPRRRLGAARGIRRRRPGRTRSATRCAPRRSPRRSPSSSVAWRRSPSPPPAAAAGCSTPG